MNSSDSAYLSKNRLAGGVLLVLFATLAYQLWLIWPQILLNSINWQRSVYAELSDLIYNTKSNNPVAGIYLTGLSFLYGILHSVGPGHGKLIISTFLATQPAKLKHGVVLATLAALMQALVAIALVSALVHILGHSMRDVNLSSNTLIRASFIAMVLLGAGLTLHSLKSLYQFLFLTRGKECHHHGLEANQINNATGIKSYIAIIVSIGIRPCSGAIMVLLFANVAGMYWLGVLSALLMAAGTAITTSCIALMTITGKKVMQRCIQSDNTSFFSLVAITLRLLGAVAILLLGVILSQSQVLTISPIF